MCWWWGRGCGCREWRGVVETPQPTPHHHYQHYQKPYSPPPPTLRPSKTPTPTHPHPQSTITTTITKHPTHRPARRLVHGRKFPRIATPVPPAKAPPAARPIPGTTSTGIGGGGGVVVVVVVVVAGGGGGGGEGGGAPLVAAGRGGGGHQVAGLCWCWVLGWVCCVVGVCGKKPGGGTVCEALGRPRVMDWNEMNGSMGANTFTAQSQ
jgi:hypothetical protein